MSEIRHRPIRQKSAIMTAEQERRYINECFRDVPCESCGIMDNTIVPAHLNLDHGGMGTKARGMIAALCFACHAIADGRDKQGDRFEIWARVAQKMMRDRAVKWKREND